MFPIVGAGKCGKSVLKKLKDLANLIAQCITSVLVISVLLNSVMVPSLENVVVPACEKLTMAGTARMAGTYWVQSCSAWADNACAIHVLNSSASNKFIVSMCAQFSEYSDVIYVILEATCITYKSNGPLTCATEYIGKLQLCCPTLTDVSAYRHFILVYIQVNADFSTPTI